MYVRQASNSVRPFEQCRAYVETISSQMSSEFGNFKAKFAYSAANVAQK